MKTIKKLLKSLSSDNSYNSGPVSLFSKLVRLIKSSLSRQLILIFSLIFSVLIVIQALIIWWGLKDHLKRANYVIAKQNAEQTAYNAGSIITTQEKILIALKKFIETSEPIITDKEALLVRISIDEEAFNYLSIIGLDGKEYVSSEPNMKLSNIKKTDFFKTSTSGKHFISSISITKDHYPFIIITLPIFHKGKVNEILYAEVNMQGIWSYLDSISQNEHINYFIISQNGILCSYRNKEFVMRNESITAKNIVRSSFSAINEPVMLSLEDNKKYLLSTAKIYNIPFYLVYQQDITPILKNLKKINILILLSSVIILVLALLIIRWLSKRFSAPILKLVKKTVLIGTDKIQNEPVIEKRLDEIGVLYRSFYDMNKKVMEASAREKLAVVGESAVGISHELKNPISAIKNFADLIISYPDDAKIKNKFAKAVPKELLRLERMLKDLSSLSLGKELIKNKFDLDKSVDEAIDLFEKELLDSKIQLIKTSQAKDASIIADEDKIKSVFINLIKNSMEAMPDGGIITLNISEKETLQEKSFLISIEDNGTGIPEHIIKNIFTPFFTTKKRGLGIGLAVSKGIIEQHRGTMQVCSQGNNKGSIFTITLPSF